MANIYKNEKTSLTTTALTSLYTVPSNSRAIVKSLNIAEDAGSTAVVKVTLVDAAAAVFVGPQLLLFFAVMPATWLIDDERLRRDVTLIISKRFGKIAAFSLLILLITGLYQFYFIVPETVSSDIGNYNFGRIFMLKMTLFVVVLGLVLFHIILGKKIGKLVDALVEGEDNSFELADARRKSFIWSAVLLFISFCILALGVLLGNPQFSYVIS